MFSELTDTVARSYWAVVAGLCVGLSLALLVLHNAAPLYEARAVKGMVLGMGSVAGLVAFVGPLLLTRFLTPIINSEIELQAVTEIPVLARIPPLANAHTRGRVRRQQVKNLVFSALSLTMLALTVALLR